MGERCGHVAGSANYFSGQPASALGVDAAQIFKTHSNQLSQRDPNQDFLPPVLELRLVGEGVEHLGGIYTLAQINLVSSLNSRRFQPFQHMLHIPNVL